MELKDLIGAVKAAKTKGDLAELVSKELSLDLDKNKTMKALRAEVLNGLGVTEDDSEDEVEAEPLKTLTSDEAQALIKEDTRYATEEGFKIYRTEQSPDSAQLIKVPAADEAPVPAPKPSTDNRLLRNTDGRIFIWTPVLAKLPGMEEV